MGMTFNGSTLIGHQLVKGKINCFRMVSSNDQNTFEDYVIIR